jgi:phasin family protein
MTPTQFPMFDFESLLKQFSMPNVDARTFMEAQQRNIEALVAANQKIVENMQKIAEREQQIIQDAISDWGNAAGNIHAEDDVQERSVRQTEVAIKAVEDGIRNMRTFADMVTKAQADSMDILNKRMDESIRELRQVAKACRNQAKPRR